MRDLQMELVSEEIKKYTVTHNQRLRHHENSEMVLNHTTPRRLKRIKLHNHLHLTDREKQHTLQKYRKNEFRLRCFITMERTYFV